MYAYYCHKHATRLGHVKNLRFAVPQMAPVALELLNVLFQPLHVLFYVGILRRGHVANINLNKEKMKPKEGNFTAKKANTYKNILFSFGARRKSEAKSIKNQ
jgi:hypothetical protein